MLELGLGLGFRIRVRVLGLGLGFRRDVTDDGYNRGFPEHKLTEGLKKGRFSAWSGQLGDPPSFAAHGYANVASPLRFSRPQRSAVFLDNLYVRLPGGALFRAVARTGSRCGGGEVK